MTTAQSSRQVCVCALEGREARECVCVCVWPTPAGDRVCMVYNRVEGTVRFYKNNEDQGMAFSEGLKGKRLMPAVVMGSSNGGKVTTVTLSSSLDVVPPEARPVDAAPRLFV